MLPCAVVALRRESTQTIKIINSGSQASKSSQLNFYSSNCLLRAVILFIKFYFLVTVQTLQQLSVNHIALHVWMVPW